MVSQLDALAGLGIPVQSYRPTAVQANAPRRTADEIAANPQDNGRRTASEITGQPSRAPRGDDELYDQLARVLGTVRPEWNDREGVWGWSIGDGANGDPYSEEARDAFDLLDKTDRVGFSLRRNDDMLPRQGHRILDLLRDSDPVKLGSALERAGYEQSELPEHYRDGAGRFHLPQGGLEPTVNYNSQNNKAPFSAADMFADLFVGAANDAGGPRGVQGIGGAGAGSYDNFGDAWSGMMSDYGGFPALSRVLNVGPLQFLNNMWSAVNGSNMGGMGGPLAGPGAHTDAGRVGPGGQQQ